MATTYVRFKRRYKNLAKQIYDQVDNVRYVISVFDDRIGGFARLAAKQLVIFLQIRAICIGLSEFSADGKENSYQWIVFQFLCKIFWRQIVPFILAVTVYRCDKYPYYRNDYQARRVHSWIYITTFGVIEALNRFLILLTFTVFYPDAYPELNLTNDMGTDRTTACWMTLFMIIHFCKITAYILHPFVYDPVQDIIDKWYGVDHRAGYFFLDDVNEDFPEADDEIIIVDENNNIVLQVVVP